jgi:hypothetical protein
MYSLRNGSLSSVVVYSKVYGVSTRRIGVGEGGKEVGIGEGGNEGVGISFGGMVGKPVGGRAIVGATVENKERQIDGEASFEHSTISFKYHLRVREVGDIDSSPFFDLDFFEFFIFDLDAPCDFDFFDFFFFFPLFA